MLQMPTFAVALLSFILHVAAEESAVLEMTGDMPKIMWGDLGDPVCALTLNRTNTRLDSTCNIFTTENAELKAEVATLKAESAQLTTEVSELKADNNELKAKVAALTNITATTSNLIWTESFSDETLKSWYVDYWGSLLAAELSSDQAFDASPNGSWFSLHHKFDGSQPGGTYFDTPAILIPQQKYLVTARLLASETLTCKLWLHDMAVGTESHTSGTYGPVLPNVWEELRVTFIATWTRKMRIHLHSEKAHNPNPASIWWDRIQIFTIQTLPS